MDNPTKKYDMTFDDSLYRKAAVDDAQAMLRLGLLYLDKAVSEGQKPMMKRRFFRSQPDVSDYYGQALMWFRRASRRGHDDANYILGMMYRNGIGVSQSYRTAKKWFRKNGGNSAAHDALKYLDSKSADFISCDDIGIIRENAANGNLDAQFRLALLYRYGTVIARDNRRSYDMLTRLAESDDPRALSLLGKIHFNEEYFDVINPFEEDRKLAFELFQKAASHETECDDPDDDEIQAFQPEFERLEREAFYPQFWYGCRTAALHTPAGRRRERLMALLGMPFTIIAALVDLIHHALSFGRQEKSYDIEFYTEDYVRLGIEPRYDDTPRWIAEAQYMLGTICADGELVEKAPALAAHWLTKAALNGSAAAQFKAGCIHLSGDGVPKDEKLAFKLFHRLALRLDREVIDVYSEERKEAVRKVAEMYRDGRGTAQDTAKALKWFHKLYSAYCDIDAGIEARKLKELMNPQKP